MSLQETITQDILDSISEGVFTVDKNFKITFFNRAAERITGFAREEVLGKFCKYVCDSGTCSDQCSIARVLKTGEKVTNRDSAIRSKNNGAIPVRVNSSVLFNNENDPVGGVISFRDMSEFEAITSRLMRESQYHGIVGHSKAMQDIFQLIEEISDADASVLILGESGTGKEIIADAIRESSQRKDKPFIKVNCSIFPVQLLASELFGHVKGAFTGAINDRLGRFEIADQGTMFLDEIVDLPLPMQSQLLRVLQEGTFERIGESLTRKVDVRVITATNRDIKEALETGLFREDLYYRLSVIPIEVPPLRERVDDIPYLVKHFITKFSMVYKKNIQEIDDEAMDLLLRYPWPGNVRELENATEHAFALSKNDDILRSTKFPLKIRQATTAFPTKGTKSIPANQDLELLDALQQHKWNKTKVAKELGIGRTTVWRRMKRIGLVDD